MRSTFLLAPALAGFLLLGGCMHGAAGNTELLDRLTELAKDPNCAHRDTINVILGPVPSGSILLDRNCQQQPAQPAPATP